MAPLPSTVWPSLIHCPPPRRSTKEAVQVVGGLVVEVFDGDVEVQPGVANVLRRSRTPSGPFLRR